MPWGGVTKRPGTQLVSFQGDEDRKARLIPFIFSTEQAYALEFGHEYIHIYMNHGKIYEDDPNDVLLLHFGGENASQTFVDSGATGHTVTANNTVQHSTLQKKLGSASCYFNLSNTDYLTVADHADFDFSSNIFTIECFFRLDYNTTFRFLVSQATDASNYMAMYVDDDMLKFEVREAGGTVQTLTSAADSVAIDTWYHARAVGDGTNYYLFLDGVLVDSEAIDQNVVNYTGALHIGKFPLSALYFSGWMDEVRINNSAVVDGLWSESESSPTFTADLTAVGSSATLTASGAYFSAGQIGSLLRLQDANDNSWGHVEITAVASGTEATATVLSELGVSGAFDYYQTGATVGGNFNPPASPYPNSSSGTAAVEVTSPYKEQDLAKIKHFQSFDTMYLFHPDYAWRKLTRTAHDTWTLSTVDYTSGPWLEELSDRTFTANATTGTGKIITASTAFFLSGHVGSLLRMKCAGSWGYVKITAVSDTTHATASIIETLGDTNPSTAYQEGAWSGVRGYPSSGCFLEESLVAMATDHQPQTVFASVKGDYENFLAGTDDDDAYIYTIPASNRILWPAPMNDLAIGTGDGIYKMTGGMDDYISPTNVRVRNQLKIGVADIAPILLGDVTLFWQKGAKKLLELLVNPNSINDNYVAPDLTRLAEHVTTGGVSYHAWSREPYSTIWSVRADGVMPVLTYLRAENVVGWSRQVTDGVVESVCSIPDPTDTFDEVWISVLREDGDGALRRTVEFFNEGIPPLDAALVYDGGNPGGSSQTLSGLDAHEGKEVSIVGDGVVYTPQTVSSGEITISPPAAYIVVGLPFTMTVTTVEPAINANGATTMGVPKKWAEVYAKVKDTSDLTINDEIIDFRTLGDVDPGEEIPLYSGDVKISQSGWDRGEITFESSDPLPCTILSVFGNLEIGDD